MMDHIFIDNVLFHLIDCTNLKFPFKEWFFFSVYGALYKQTFRKVIEQKVPGKSPVLLVNSAIALFDTRWHKFTFLQTVEN